MKYEALNYPSIPAPSERANVVPYALVDLDTLLLGYGGKWDTAELLEKRNLELGISKLSTLPVAMMDKDDKIEHYQEMSVELKTLLAAMYNAKIQVIKVNDTGLAYILDGETKTIVSFKLSEFDSLGVAALNDIAYRKFPRLCRYSASGYARISKENITDLLVRGVTEVDANPMRTASIYTYGAAGVDKKVLNILENNLRPVANTTVKSTESDAVIADIVFKGLEATTEHIAKDNATDGNVDLMLLYIRSGIASMMLPRHAKTAWAFAFQGKQGTGKSGLANFISTLIGVSIEVGAGALFGNFNQGAVRKLCVHVVEAFCRTAEQAEIIKGLIDGSEQMLNEKHEKAGNVKNYTKYVFSMNGWANFIHSLGEARRFFMLNVNSFIGSKIDATVPFKITEAQFKVLSSYVVPVITYDDFGQAIAADNETPVFTVKPHHVVDADGMVTISNGELIPITGQPDSSHMGIMKLVVAKIAPWYDISLDLGNVKTRPLTKGLNDARSEVIATVELTQNVNKVAQTLKETGGVGDGKLSADYIALDLIMNDTDGKKHLNNGREELLTAGIVINKVLYTLHNFNKTSYMLPISEEERRAMPEVDYQNYLADMAVTIENDIVDSGNGVPLNANEKLRAYIEDNAGATYDDKGNLENIELFKAVDLSGFDGKVTNMVAVAFNKVNSGYTIKRPFNADGTFTLLGRTATKQAKLFTEDF